MPGGPASGGAGLRATDVGVTGNSVKVGFLLIDTGGVGALGVKGLVDLEQQRSAVRAYVDEVNDHGGIGGRKIEAVYAPYDPLSSYSGNSGRSTGRAACLSLTEDNHVFAVLGFLDSTTRGASPPSIRRSCSATTSLPTVSSPHPMDARSATSCAEAA